jgi:hypothetical protein
MGATHHIGIIKGKTASSAFNAAQDEARYDYGSSYTGTIAEADGYIMGSPAPRWDAQQAAARALNDGTVTKWGSALLIPVLPVPKTRTVTAVVDVTDLENAAAENRDGHTMASFRERERRIFAAVHALLKQGEGVDSATEESGTITSKAVVTTHDGPLVRRFHVIDRYGKSVAVLPTMKEAKAWAVAHTAHSRIGLPDRYSIEHRTRHENEPLVTVALAYTKFTIKVTAKVGVPDRSAPVTEWVTAGVYSC